MPSSAKQSHPERSKVILSEAKDLFLPGKNRFLALLAATGEMLGRLGSARLQI
jgi:hypothetical protein